MCQIYRYKTWTQWKDNNGEVEVVMMSLFVGIILFTRAYYNNGCEQEWYKVKRDGHYTRPNAYNA